MKAVGQGSHGHAEFYTGTCARRKAERSAHSAQLTGASRSKAEEMGRRMIESMEQVHMTDAEEANNFAAVLEKLKNGAEVVVEQDHRPVAVIKAVRGSGRPIDECIALAKVHGSGATLDESFAKDLEVIGSRQPLDTSVWE